MKRLKIEVLQSDINDGERGQSSSCAIAKAIKRQFPEAKHVDVRGFVVIDNIYYKESRAAEQFITKFDRSKELVQPSTFIVSPYATVDSVTGKLLKLDGSGFL